VQLGAGLAVATGFQACGEEAAGFVAADRAAALARHVAVAGVDLDGGAFGADAEFDDPVRGRRAVAAAVFLFGLPPLQGCDLVVDALYPQGMPDPQRLQTIQVRRQVIEHIFDSMPMIHGPRPSRVRFYVR
jgi:hypothetical protein